MRRASCFNRFGPRIFFPTLQAWIDHVLPLDLPIPAEIQRARVGRIEWVIAQQQAFPCRIAEIEPARGNPQS